MPARLLAGIAALFLGVSAPARGASAQDGVRVIVNPATPVAALSRDQVSRLFLKKVSRWDGGVPVLPVDQRETSGARASFSREIHRRTVGMITLYWQRQIFSGRQIPPPEKESDADIVAYVRSTPGAIGYVGAGVELRGVRVVPVTQD